MPLPSGKPFDRNPQASLVVLGDDVLTLLPPGGVRDTDDTSAAAGEIGHDRALDVALPVPGTFTGGLGNRGRHGTWRHIAGGRTAKEVAIPAIHLAAFQQPVRRQRPAPHVRLLGVLDVKRGGQLCVSGSFGVLAQVGEDPVTRGGHGVASFV